MQLVKRVRDGECFPAWYGLAYYDYCQRVAVCYPIPLNWLIGRWRSVLLAIRLGPRQNQLEHENAILRIQNQDLRTMLDRRVQEVQHLEAQIVVLKLLLASARVGDVSDGELALPVLPAHEGH